jgi:hypothetical protein
VQRAAQHLAQVQVDGLGHGPVTLPVEVKNACRTTRAEMSLALVQRGLASSNTRRQPLAGQFQKFTIS